MNKPVKIQIKRNCMLCGKEGTLEVTEDIWQKIGLYEAGYGYIQDIELPADQREFIKTGMCPACQHDIFDLHEEEEELVEV